MKKVYYCINSRISEDVYLYYNAFKNCFLFLNAIKNDLYQNSTPENIHKRDAPFYELLLENGFVEDDEIDELSIVEFRKMSLKLNSYQYNIVINTTLDCNLNCWYCYETKVEGSVLEESVLDVIKKNILQKYKDLPYRELKISFFGGEPLKNFKAVENILSFCQKFASENNILLIADFTTNSTLLTNRMLSFLKDFKCLFQITLDGHEERHNQIRFLKKNQKGTYQLVINNIHRIQNCISDVKIWIRINFDDKTLENFSEIINNLSSLDRNRCYLILRKVWQFPIENIRKSHIMAALQLAMDNGFAIDYYSLPRSEVCFADRVNEVLFNYDGKVFKCSTLDAFDEEHTDGKVDEETGRVIWDVNKLSKKMMQRSPERCRLCKIYPVCLGPCAKNAANGDNFK